MNVLLPLPPLTANWITASQLNIELHPVKIQIYRCSALTISGFNVIFILQSSQALCPSSTFRLKTDRTRQTNILLSDVKDLTSFSYHSEEENQGVKPGEGSHSQLLFIVSFYSFIRPTLMLLLFFSFFSPSLPFLLLLCSHSSFSLSAFLFSYYRSSFFYSSLFFSFLVFLNFSFICFYFLLLISLRFLVLPLHGQGEEAGWS